ncbi:hypothetical protein LCGC14_0848700, partial [marine sediment metagenome]
YLTNIMKTRPPGNNFGVFYEDAKRRIPSKMLVIAREELISEIRKIKPNVVVALGAEALKALAGKYSIESWRGSLLKIVDNIKLIPTYHPAYILRVYKHRTIVELDLKKAKAESLFPELRYTPPKFEICPSYACVMDRLAWIRAKRPRISLDIESSGRVIRCLGIGWKNPGNVEAICIPFACRAGFQPNSNILMLPSNSQDFLGSSYWSLEEEQEILKALDGILPDASIPKVLQNFPFDAELLWKGFGLHISGLHMDTMVAQHCCYSELPKSLDFLTSIYTDIPYYADYDASNDESTFIYNCLDCVSTIRSSYRLDKELEQMSLTSFYHDHAQPEMEALGRLQNRGIPVSEPARQQMRVELQGQVDKTRRLISERLGESFNPRSHLQMKKLLYESLGLPKQFDRKTHKITSDAKAIERLINRFPQHLELLNGIIQFKSSEKLINRFLINPLRNGRQYTSFNSTGTVTGRLSSSENIWGEGDNLQNINRGPIRRIFACDEGSWWIKVDLSQAEARAVAWLAPLPMLVDRFANDKGFDIHTWNAAENIYKVPADTITKEQRYMSKCGVHGGNYGLREVTAAAIYKISIEEAKHAIESYQQAVEIEKRYWKPIQLELASTRALRTPFGRQRIFFDRINDETYRSAYSTKPQSLVADIIGRALFVLDPLLYNYNCYSVLQLHDELDFICPKENLENVMPIILEVMEYPVDFSDYNGVKELMTIPAEASYGTSWYEEDQTEWKGN